MPRHDPLCGKNPNKDKKSSASVKLCERILPKVDNRYPNNHYS